MRRLRRLRLARFALDPSGAPLAKESAADMRTPSGHPPPKPGDEKILHGLLGNLGAWGSTLSRTRVRGIFDYRGRHGTPDTGCYTA